MESVSETRVIGTHKQQFIIDYMHVDHCGTPIQPVQHDSLRMTVVLSRMCGIVFRWFEWRPWTMLLTGLGLQTTPSSSWMKPYTHVHTTSLLIIYI